MQDTTNILNQSLTAGALLQAGKALRAPTLESLQRLLAWRWKREAENPDCVTERPVVNGSLTVDEDGIPLFRTILWYSNIAQAMDIMLYNVALSGFLYVSNALGNGNSL